MSRNFPRLLLLRMVSGESLSLVEEKPETPNTTGFFFANLPRTVDGEAIPSSSSNTKSLLSTVVPRPATPKDGCANETDVANAVEELRLFALLRRFGICPIIITPPHWVYLAIGEG